MTLPVVVLVSLISREGKETLAPTSTETEI